MSIKLTTLKLETIAEISAATGSEQLIDKATRRNFVGLYDDDKGWYIPLRARLGATKPESAYYATPFETSNPHFKNPGLDFQKALYVEADGVLEIRNTLPKEQSDFIHSHETQIKEKFETYVLSIETLPISSAQYRFSTIPLFPEGIEKIKSLVKTEVKVEAKLSSKEKVKNKDSEKSNLIMTLDLTTKDFSAQSIADNAHRISDYLNSLGAKTPYSVSSVKLALEYAEKNLNVSHNELQQAYMTQQPLQATEKAKSDDIQFEKETLKDKLPHKNISVVDIAFSTISHEVFQKRTDTSSENKKDWSQFSIDEAYQEFIKDVWQSRHDYISKESGLTETTFTEKFKSYFYESDTTYNQTHVLTFKDNYNRHVAKLQNKKSLQPDLKVIDMVRSKNIEGLSKHMKEGLKDYLKSDTYKNYLNFVSTFHSYSQNNLRLILSQNPNASLIAGAGTWKKEHSRYPSKGEKALYIWSPPLEYIQKDKNGKPKLDSNGKVQKKKYFKLLPVFDVEQTSGKELPHPVVSLSGEVKNYENLYLAIRNSIDTPVKFEKLTEGVHGYFEPSKNQIVLNAGMSQEATIKTFIHEATHSQLHTNSNAKFGDKIYQRQEFEAESVAYVVCQHYGIDSSNYSFGYLASWQMNKLDLDDLKNVMATVQKQSHDLLTKIDKALEKQMSKVVEKNPLQVEIDNIKLPVTETPQPEKTEGAIQKLNQGF